MEINVTINAPELSAAINNLATAIAGKAPVAAPHPSATVAPQTSTPVAAPQSQQTVATPGPANQVSATQSEATTPVQPTAPNIESQAIPQTAPAPQTSTPVAAPQQTTITLDALCKAGAELVEQGRMDQVINLLGKYGVQAVNQLAASNYDAFAADLRAIGGQV